MAWLKNGKGRILNGNFKIVHVIELTEYDKIIKRISPIIELINTTSILKPQLNYQLNQINNSIKQLKGIRSKSKRSLNWIGSAWKWIAGSPDATDWDTILKSENKIINNNNQQYKINREIMKITNEIVKEYNQILDQLNTKTNDKFEQMMYNKLSIIREAVNEITLAAQLAQSGIVNSNLLNKEEISKIMEEIETLPYSNEIEAVEYAKPTMIIKESTILYVLSIPKTSNTIYDHIILRSTIQNNKQIHLEYKEILSKLDEIYGIKESCDDIKNTTICRSNQIQKLPKTHCINQLIKGINKQCELQYSENEIIEEINENTIFLTNFDGQLESYNTSRNLKGSFLIQFYNETIKIKNQEFTNKNIITTQVLPPVFQTNPSEGSIKLDVNYLHSLNTNNTERLENLSTKLTISKIFDISIISVVLIIIIIFFIHRFLQARPNLFIPPEINLDLHPAANSI